MCIVVMPWLVDVTCGERKEQLRNLWHDVGVHQEGHCVGGITQKECHFPGKGLLCAAANLSRDKGGWTP